MHRITRVNKRPEPATGCTDCIELKIVCPVRISEDLCFDSVTFPEWSQIASDSVGEKQKHCLMSLSEPGIGA